LYSTDSGALLIPWLLFPETQQVEKQRTKNNEQQTVDSNFEMAFQQFEDVSELLMLNIGLQFISGFSAADLLAVISKKKVDRFRSAYGASPATSTTIFRDQVLDIGDAQLPEVKVEHFLMSLLWLRIYPTETMILSTFGIESEKTVRKWVWGYCCAIQALSSHKVRTFNTITRPSITQSLTPCHCTDKNFL
jgi:hypothetical protein